MKPQNMQYLRDKWIIDRVNILNSPKILRNRYNAVTKDLSE